MENNEIQVKQAISEWRKCYLETLIDELRPFGDVLQVGFDSISAERILTYHPKSLTIIEQDQQLAADAKIWSKKYPNATIIQSTWQTALPDLKVFDVVFFNDLSFDSSFYFMGNVTSNEVNQALEEAKKMLGKMQQELSQIKVIYSDLDIEKFYQDVGRFKLNELPSFFKNLKDNNQITEVQYQNALKKYQFKNEIPDKLVIEDTNQPEEMVLFLDECVNVHMHKGSRFSSVLRNQTSKYLDPQFFDKVITNLALDYKEKAISIETPSSTQYNFPKEVLVILVEKH